MYRTRGSLRFDFQLPELGADVRDAEVTTTSTGLRFAVGPFALDAVADSASGTLRGQWGRASETNAAQTGPRDRNRTVGDDAEQGENRERSRNSRPEVPTSRVYLVKSPPPVEHFSREEVLFETTGAELVGTLLLPASREPVAGAVFVTGRSNGPRGQHVRMAETLAAHGTAALIFDSRGTGESTGDAGSLTERQRIDDVLAALEYLDSRPEIDAARLGLFTHSAGGWVGPQVATESSKVSWMIMNQGPVMSLADQQGLAMNTYMRMQGTELSDEDERRSFEYHAELTRLGQSGAEWEEIARHIETISEESWADVASRPESYDNDDLDYYRRRPDFDPSDDWRGLDIPVLLLFGAEDWIVPWQENVERLEQLVDLTDRDVSYVVFPDAGHGMMRIAGGMQGEGEWPDGWYRWPSTAPGYEAVIVEWLSER